MSCVFNGKVAKRLVKKRRVALKKQKVAARIDLLAITISFVLAWAALLFVGSRL